MLKASVLFPTGNGTYPDPMFIGDYTDIQSAVGGLFTTVTYNAELANGDKMVLVGYLPDEIYERNHETINWYASALFQQELYGPCVVAWGLSPNGFYDGDIYDMPDDISAFLFGPFTQKVVEAYTQAGMMGAMFNNAVKDGVITEDELDDLMDFIEAQTNDDTEHYTDDERLRMLVLLNRVENYVLTEEIKNNRKSQES